MPVGFRRSFQLKEVWIVIFTVILTAIAGYIVWIYQTRVSKKERENELKERLFIFINDLELRREQDLKAVNKTFEIVVLVERGRENNSLLDSVSFPKKIDVSTLDQLSQESFHLLPERYRAGVDALKLQAIEINKLLDSLYTKMNAKKDLTIKDVTGIHCQIIIYGYTVHQLDLLGERYILPNIPHQELLEMSANAFGLSLSIDDIIANHRNCLARST